MNDWSDKLKNLTKTQAYAGAMMKNLKGEFGMIKTRTDSKIIIVETELDPKIMWPMPTDKEIASFNNVEEMIKDGWVID